MSHTDKKEDFKKELYRLWSMHADRKNYNVSRRDLIKGMAGLGLGAGAIKMLMNQAPFSVREAWAAEGATPEERAINGAKALFADAPKKTISVMYPSGSGGNLSPFVEEWKGLTGFDLELIEVPVTETHQKAMQEAVAKTGRYDIMIPAPLSLADLAESGVARPLDDFMDKYDPEVYSGPNKLQFPVSEFGQKYKGKTYGLYCDGDWWHLSYRKDKLAEKGLAPKSKREMVHTWTEYDALCAEMHDPGQQLLRRPRVSLAVLEQVPLDDACSVEGPLLLRRGHELDGRLGAEHRDAQGADRAAGHHAGRAVHLRLH